MNFQIVENAGSMVLYRNGSLAGHLVEHEPQKQTRRHAAEICVDLGKVYRLTGRIFAYLGARTIRYYELVS